MSCQCLLPRNMGCESLDERQQKTREIPKTMPFKIRGTRAQGPKAAKSPRNPKNDAFQGLFNKSPRTKGSKKAQEIQKSMPFKIHRTRAQGPKAAKNSRNQEIVAFHGLKDKSPRTKGSKKPKKSKKRCLSRIVGHEPLDERQQKAQEIQKTMPFKNYGR